MNIFELHFNPPPKKDSADLALDTFCFEPKNLQEKKFGSLYMAGEIRNLLPQNIKLLNNIAQVIKNRFYAISIHSPEKAIDDSLEKTNEFLAQELSKENISWLGNLSFAAIYLRPKGRDKKSTPKDFVFNCAKVGNIKILILRKGAIIDAGKNLDLHEIEPYPLKVFTSTVAGQLFAGDKMVVITKDIFDFFSKEGLLDKLAAARVFTEQKIKVILQPKEKILAEISGLLLLIDTEKDLLVNPGIITFNRHLETFSFKDVFAPIATTISKILTRQKKPKRKKIPPIKKWLSIGIANFIGRYRPTEKEKMNQVLFLIFLFLLIAGFFIFQGKERQLLKDREEIIKEVEGKISEAENLLVINNEKKATVAFKEALRLILPLTKENKPLENAINLKNYLEDNLKKISKLEFIEEPNAIFEFNQQEFIPQKMIYFRSKLYLFSPLSANLYALDIQTKNNDVYNLSPDKKEKPSLAAISDDRIFFLLKPNTIISFNGEGFEEYLNLEVFPSSDEPQAMSFYQNSIYLLNKEQGEIIKYQTDNQRSIWLDPATKKATEGISMAIDGSVWILNDSTVSRYHSGKLQEDIPLDFFPSPKQLSKILTSSAIPYLYILEPSQNRIIILSKSGDVIKQVQSDKFNNLKDVAISSDDRMIYLLSGQTLFSVDL